MKTDLYVVSGTSPTSLAGSGLPRSSTTLPEVDSTGEVIGSPDREQQGWIEDEHGNRVTGPAPSTVPVTPEQLRKLSESGRGLAGSTRCKSLAGECGCEGFEGAEMMYLTTGEERQIDTENLKPLPARSYPLRCQQRHTVESVRDCADCAAAEAAGLLDASQIGLYSDLCLSDIDKSLRGWASRKNQKRNLTYKQKMGSIKGRYPTTLHLPGHDMSWSVYDNNNESDQDNGAAGFVSSHEAYKPYGGDPTHPQDLTTGFAPRTATPCSPEFQERERIERFRRRSIRQAPELFTVESVYGGKHGALKIVPAGEYARVQYEQGALILPQAGNWDGHELTPFKKLVQSLGLHFPAGYGSANYACFGRDLRTASSTTQRSQPSAYDPEHPYDEQLSDQDRQRVEIALDPLDEPEYHEGVITLGVKFSGIDPLLKQYQKNASRPIENQKAWHGRAPWWRATWPGSHMLAPVYGFGKFKERRWGGQLHDQKITVEGMQLVWLRSENGCAVLGWEHREPWTGLRKEDFDIGVIQREPWEPVDGLVWTEKWKVPYCAHRDCGHFLTDKSVAEHKVNPLYKDHHVYDKVQTWRYGREVVYSRTDYSGYAKWRAALTFIESSYIFNIEKWQKMVETEREKLAVNVATVEKIREKIRNQGLAGSMKYQQIIQEVLLHHMTEEEGAKLTGVTLPTFKRAMSRFRNMEAKTSIELWEQGLQGEEPGVYVIAKLDYSPVRYYRIADLDANDETIATEFHNRLLGMVLDRADKNRLPSLNGNAEHYRKEAIKRGFPPLSDRALACRLLYQELTSRMLNLRTWPGLATVDSARMVAILAMVLYLYEAGIGYGLIPAPDEDDLVSEDDLSSTESES
jgi:hypothetical protein